MGLIKKIQKGTAENSLSKKKSGLGEARERPLKNVD